MIGLSGRPEVTPTIEEVRELSLEEIRATPRQKLARVQRLRDSHHMAARLIAMGLKQFEVAEQSGYSIQGIWMLSGDPAFQELVAHYREILTEQWAGSADEYFRSLVSVRTKALRQISDQLDKAEAEGRDLPLNQLHSIHADSADRTGYPKRRESVNLNLDFADKLDRATQRSREVKTINATPLPSDAGATPATARAVVTGSSNPEGSGGTPSPALRPPVGAAGSSASDGAERGAELEGPAPLAPRFPRGLLPEPRIFPRRARRA